VAVPSVRIPAANLPNPPNAPSNATNGIVIAPNSQATSLSFLEQMTPSERERYYRDLRLRNTQTIDINTRAR
jgi:hypothetical protein